MESFEERGRAGLLGMSISTQTTSGRILHARCQSVDDLLVLSYVAFVKITDALPLPLCSNRLLTCVVLTAYCLSPN